MGLHRIPQLDFSRSPYLTCKIILITVIVTGWVGPATVSAQTFTDYTPTGFTLPFLKKGQYILVAASSYFDSKTTSTFRSSNLDRLTYRVTGILGGTDKFTLGMTLDVLPGSTSSSTIITQGSNTINQFESKSKLQIIPQMTAAYRITDNSQFYVSGSYENLETESRQRLTLGSNSTLTNTIDDTRRYFVTGGFVWRGGF